MSIRKVDGFNPFMFNPSKSRNLSFFIEKCKKVVKKI